MLLPISARTLSSSRLSATRLVGPCDKAEGLAATPLARWTGEGCPTSASRWDALVSRRRGIIEGRSVAYCLLSFAAKNWGLLLGLTHGKIVLGPSGERSLAERHVSPST